MRIKVGARTDVGLVRQRNEDAYTVREPLFAVADGMGGHRGGNVASTLALEVIEQADPDDDSRLVQAVREANRQVFRRGEQDRELQGMGTTVTALLIRPAGALLAHVGDSRAYLLHDGELRQLTHDHTLVQRWVDEGRLTAEDAHHHPQRNVVTRALGVDEELPIDETTLELGPGDRVLLCSDGLTGMVADDRIRDVLAREPDPQSAADLLVEMALEAGGEDNVTVVVVEVQDLGSAPGDAATAQPQGTEPGEPGEPGGSTEPADADPAEMIRRAEARGAGSGPPTKPAARTRGPFPWKKTLVWTFGAVVVVAVALVGVRSYLDRQWYVGESEGVVAVFRGIPARPLGISLSTVKVRTDIATADAERLQPWQDLPQGINVGSQQEAMSLVTQIRSDVDTENYFGHVATPTPSPAPGASTGAGAG